MQPSTSKLGGADAAPSGKQGRAKRVLLRPPHGSGALNLPRSDADRVDACEHAKQ